MFIGNLGLWVVLVVVNGIGGGMREKGEGREREGLEREKRRERKNETNESDLREGSIISLYALPDPYM